MTARFTVYPGQAQAEAISASFEGRVEIGQSVADGARSDAPVLTGEFRDGIALDIQGERVFVVDNDETAIFKEYGTVDTPPAASLTNSARSHGEYSGWEPR